MEIIRIPAERIKALIGERGKTKGLIEDKCNVKLEIDEDGEVHIEGDSSDVFFAKDVVKAIGRGFEPRDALKIVNENYNFELIELKEELKNEKAITRIKGRIIGEKGKMKSEIEAATESVIAVHGYTVGIISRLDTMEYAKEAITMIIDGAEHSSVYNYLAKMKKKILADRLIQR
jgi:ribosomal RNA assembly protein